MDFVFICLKGVYYQVLGKYGYKAELYMDAKPSLCAVELVSTSRSPKQYVRERFAWIGFGSHPTLGTGRDARNVPVAPTQRMPWRIKTVLVGRAFCTTPTHMVLPLGFRP